MPENRLHLGSIFAGFRAGGFHWLKKSPTGMDLALEIGLAGFPESRILPW